MLHHENRVEIAKKASTASKEAGVKNVVVVSAYMADLTDILFGRMDIEGHEETWRSCVYLYSWTTSGRPSKASLQVGGSEATVCTVY